jgi:hypothetical protein
METNYKREIRLENPQFHHFSQQDKNKPLNESPLFLPTFPASENWPKGIKDPAIMPDYRKVTANMVDKELGSAAWAELDKELDDLPQSRIDELCQALELQNWDFPIFDNTDLFPYYGLAALKQQKISVQTFATLMAYWSVRQHHPRKEIQVVHLFNSDGTINADARTMIKATMRVSSELGKQFLGGKEDYLDEKQLDQFFLEMKKLPQAEQQFFVVNDPNDYYGGDSLARVLEKKEPISTRIGYLGINIFCRFKIHKRKKEVLSSSEHVNSEEKYNPRRMIASLGMMQCFINLRYPENAVQMTPKIGLGTLEDIENNGITMTREFAIPFPKRKGGPDYPKEADYYQAHQEYEFMWHDFYHAILASQVPSNHQKAMILIAHKVKEMSRDKNFQTPLAQRFLSELYERLIDMEFPMYRNEADLNNEANFLGILNVLIDIAIGRMVYERFNDLKMKENFTDYENLIYHHKIRNELNLEIDQFFYEFNPFFYLSKLIKNILIEQGIVYPASIELVQLNKEIKYRGFPHKRTFSIQLEEAFKA